jgi:hypothetical protein
MKAIKLIFVLLSLIYASHSATSSESDHDKDVTVVATDEDRHLAASLFTLTCTGPVLSLHTAAAALYSIGHLDSLTPFLTELGGLKSRESMSSLALSTSALGLCLALWAAPGLAPWLQRPISWALVAKAFILSGLGLMHLFGNDLVTPMYGLAALSAIETGGALTLLFFLGFLDWFTKASINRL